MNEEINKNIKKIKEEEERKSPNSKGFDFQKENEKIRNLERDRKREKYRNIMEQRERRLWMLAGAFMIYFVLFTAFTTHSIFSIRKNMDEGAKNQTISEITPEKVVATKEENGIVVDIYSVEQFGDDYKIRYGIYNKESAMENVVLNSGIYLLREDDQPYSMGIQYHTLKKEALSKGEAMTGFFTFIAEKEEDKGEKEGYYTLNEEGDLIFIEGKAPGEEESEEPMEPEEESSEKKEDNTEGLNLKLVIPVLNKDGLTEIMVEITR